MMTTLTKSGEPRKSPAGRRPKYTQEQIDWMNGLRKAGYTTGQIAEQFQQETGVATSVATLQKILEPAARPAAPGGREVRVKMTDETRLKMIELAEHFGMLNTMGEHAGRGSVAKLCEAIAQGHLAIVRTTTQEDDQ